ncbi:hypothetical protein [Burkholderia lata]|uniref:hypothetical protein n=1 Tax=Burkholderia lata (strain ATCC 17760 / DSM 23089 / LMG 22485 / NCIMB 9086 / R18194 / 383) TaxID=482957 RepID=UPI001452CD87|nr:hypothetical protein [Burkholderia lata]VWB41403.1 hypothetical protein BLA15816_01876 [Burkholderia lata]
MHTQKRILCVAFLSLLSACATLAPERDAASNLMGKDINEAIKRFGRPNHTGVETSVSRDSKFYGQRWYMFTRNGAAWDSQRAVGTAVEGNTVVQYVETVHTQERCDVMLWTDKQNIIGYYEVKGNCGLWNAGFGNTGALHRIGIN